MVKNNKKVKWMSKSDILLTKNGLKSLSLLYSGI